MLIESNSDVVGSAACRCKLSVLHAQFLGGPTPVTLVACQSLLNPALCRVEVGERGEVAVFTDPKAATRNHIPASSS